LSINNFKGNPEYESYTDSIFQGQSLALPKRIEKQNKNISDFLRFLIHFEGDNG